MADKNIDLNMNLDQNGDMFYSVLWLPPRYKVLCLYLLLIPVVIGLIAIDKGTVYFNITIHLLTVHQNLFPPVSVTEDYGPESLRIQLRLVISRYYILDITLDIVYRQYDMAYDKSRKINIRKKFLNNKV